MRLITTLYKHFDLLPEFLHYYSQYVGITQFIIGYHASLSKDEVSECCKNYNCVILESYKEEYDCHLTVLATEKIRKQYIESKEWHMVVDLDEFHIFPMQLEKLISECESGNYNWVAGNLYDCFAITGELEKFDKIRPWKQFPIKTRFTEFSVGGNSFKVQLVRGPDLKITPGLHSVINGSRYYLEGVVNHYKWNANLIERLEERVEVYQKYGGVFVSRPKKVFEHLKNGKIDLNAISHERHKFPDHFLNNISML